MSRNVGDFIFPANFEVTKVEPLDGRQLVGTKADLTGTTTWNQSGGVWLYDGAIVSVGQDPVPENNGIYFLASASTYTDINSWVKAGTGEGGGTITGGTNGLSTSGENIVLGGTLTGNTTIDVDNKNLTISGGNLVFTGNSSIDIKGTFITNVWGDFVATLLSESQASLGVVSGCSSSCQAGLTFRNTGDHIFYDQVNERGVFYCTDYGGNSGNDPRWIPDVAWVTGNTGIGNVSWNGSTANAVGRYVDSDTICADPNLLVCSTSIQAFQSIQHCAGKDMAFYPAVNDDDRGDVVWYTSGGTETHRLWTDGDAEACRFWVRFSGDSLQTRCMVHTGNIVDGTIPNICAGTRLYAPAITLTTGAAAGCVLQSDASGNGTWVTPAAGIAWNGSTANGVGTYVDANTVQSEPNMTFNGTTLNITGAVDASTYVCGGQCVQSPLVCGTTCVRGSTVCSTGNILASAGNVVAGTNTKTSDTVIRVLAGDAYTAGFQAYGSSQGTGYVCVGQSTTYGGGIFYNGDGAPAFATGEVADRTGFFRNNNGTKNVVFDYGVGDDTVYFRGTTCAPTVCGTTSVISPLVCGVTSMRTPLSCFTYACATGGDLMAIGAGETAGQFVTNVPAGENLWLGAETGIRIVSSPDNWGTGWAGRNEAVLVNTSANSIFPGCVQATVHCGTTCVTTPISCGTTRVQSPIVCGSTSVNTPTLCNTTNIRAGASTETGIFLAANSCVQLYYNNLSRLKTITDGICVLGNNIYTDDKLIFDTTSTAKYICQPAGPTPAILRIVAGNSTDASTGGGLVLCGGNNTSTGAGGSICIAAGCGGTSLTEGSVFIRANNATTGLGIFCGGVGSSSSYVGLYQGGTRRFNTAAFGICVASCGVGVDWIATSDCRLKKCVTPISNALSTVDALCGVNYQLCDEKEEGNRIGLIAQDVVKVLPEVVTHSPVNNDGEDNNFGIEDKIWGIKYEKLTAVLIEAVKELKTQNDCLQEQINELKNN